MKSAMPRVERSAFRIADADFPKLLTACINKRFIGDLGKWHLNFVLEFSFHFSYGYRVNE
ncbi:hypothetical protein [Caballeronia humi]|uniref:hypothetical protein n=1 Tax=Caballeronia humi TaxID=326474 RepID=UPI000A67D92E|nr:hypothetical protein [Caballeronia humi]